MKLTEVLPGWKCVEKRSKDTWNPFIKKITMEDIYKQGFELFNIKISINGAM
jgi:hypothetical protein